MLFSCFIYKSCLILCNETNKNIMKALILSILAIFGIFYLTSCSEITDEQHIYVDLKFKPYYGQFLIEAKQRGLDFSKQDITMIHKDLSAQSYCGLTVYDKGTVYIDTTSFCWNTNPLELISHELGHYFLKREHDNTLINGQIKSIMTAQGFLLSLDLNRKYYMDELFNPNTNTKLIPTNIDTVKLQYTVEENAAILHHGT